jgi:hypothetical protein
MRSGAHRADPGRQARTLQHARNPLSDLAERANQFRFLVRDRASQLSYPS